MTSTGEASVLNLATSVVLRWSRISLDARHKTTLSFGALTKLIMSWAKYKVDLLLSCRVSMLLMLTKELSLLAASLAPLVSSD